MTKGGLRTCLSELGLVDRIKSFSRAKPQRLAPLPRTASHLPCLDPLCDFKVLKDEKILDSFGDQSSPGRDCLARTGGVRAHKSVCRVCPFSFQDQRTLRRCHGDDGRTPQTLTGRSTCHVCHSAPHGNACGRCGWLRNPQAISA